MKVRTYPGASGFLRNTQAALESNEAANSLMLGVCLRLVRDPDRIETPPCLKTVEDSTGLMIAAMMTPPHKLVVYGHRGDLDEGARVLAEDLVGEQWVVPGVLGPRDVATRVVGKWAETTGTTCELEDRLTVYDLRQVENQAPERGRLRLAPAGDVELVNEWRYGFHTEIFGEAEREEERRAAARGIENRSIYLWDDQGPVSMAAKTRPTRNGGSVSLVYTPPELRGRGYATACVGELSRLLLESGWR